MPAPKKVQAFLCSQIGLAVLAWGNIFEFLKRGNEIAGGMELQILSDIPDGHIGMGKQFTGKVDPLGKIIVGHSHPSFCFEAAGKMLFRNSQILCQ